MRPIGAKFVSQISMGSDSFKRHFRPLLCDGRQIREKIRRKKRAEENGVQKVVFTNFLKSWLLTL